MESWFLILVSISISFFLKIVFNKFLTSKKLPPGPLTFPFIGNLLWLRMSASKVEPILRSLHAKFGPMVTLRIGTRTAIFVADRTLAHEALILSSAVYADRPPPGATRRLINSNLHIISSSSYGPTWRLLRRNLTAEILHPSRVKSYTHARNWVLQILQNRFESQAKAGRPICAMEHFQYAMFCLLVLMCFGDKLDEDQIKRIKEVQRQMIVNFGKFNILNFWPRVTKILLRNRWKELFFLRKCQDDVLIPLIRARKKAKEERVNKTKKDKKDYEDEYVSSYVDTLLDLELPEEKRKLREEEMWKAVDGDDVDLSEKEEFTVVMKNPLQAQTSSSAEPIPKQSIDLEVERMKVTFHVVPTENYPNSEMASGSAERAAFYLKWAP
ncbi:hypothetical protein DKX38_011530 [Salix brachista]|uniref:Cytochrome P450 n=1 Tax=Salix brachista TaxID=2182728 RepID=A0A5N5LYY2_9ROSI|nr:hypothetical protein DKX38_011530 [Salix brachista]